MTTSINASPLPPSEEPRRWLGDPLVRLATVLVILATGWFLLTELASLLRPLLLAVLFCYAIIPIHQKLHQGRSGLMTIAIMVGAVLLIGAVLGVVVYGNIIEMNEELPRLTHRAQELTKELRESVGSSSRFLGAALDDLLRAEARGESSLKEISAKIMKIAGDVLLEALIVGLYVIFLLVEASRLSQRVRVGFDRDGANRILEVVHSINLRISRYLRAKVRASLFLSIPVTVVLFAFGVKFAVVWGILTFFCNFIPYVGTAAAAGLPILFVFLDLPSVWQPITVTVCILLCHIASASFIEPIIIGRAVGLSPMVILLSLTFWGLCWGLVGMFLAVPMTVSIKIIMDHISATRPVSQLLGDDPPE